MLDFTYRWSIIDPFMVPKWVGKVIRGRRPQSVIESKKSLKTGSELNFKESAFMSPEMRMFLYFTVRGNLI